MATDFLTTAEPGTRFRRWFPHMIIPLKMRKADWSEHDHVEIERLRVAYPAPRYEVECSHTDEGDPWCIVHDHEMGVVVLHIARIDGSYVLVRDGKKVERHATIVAAINRCCIKRFTGSC